MNCNSGIRDDDSDVDIETISDTAWSVEMPEHSIQNISSASTPISAKPLETFHGVDTGDEIPITRSYSIKKTSSRKSGKTCVSQALSLKSQAENSAARCFVILGQEPKQLSEKKLTKAQPQPKYTLVHNRVRCHISTTTSATMKVRSTELARRTYIRNPAIRAIDKEGSYQHYLHRKIKQLISIMFTYIQNVDREIRLYLFDVDLYIPDFVHEFKLMKSKVGSNYYESQFKLLTSKAESCFNDLARRSHMINSMLDLYANDLEKKIMMLNYKIASYVHDLGKQITQVNSKINSYVAGLQRKLCMLNLRSQQFADYVNRGYVALMPERVLV